MDARGFPRILLAEKPAAAFRFAVFTFSGVPGHAARGQRHFVLQFLLFQGFSGMLPASNGISFCSFYFFKVSRACCPRASTFRF
ncbi:MAG TPA: hypothetical protein VHR86_08415, partial [Armatimonadota bacterium]|nr:hypothetical protein [Armatimonadota bacterium]